MIRVPIPTRLSSRLSQIRHRAGLTQRELASLARIHRALIGHYETGRVEPRILNLLRIMKACGISPVEFFDREIRLWEPTAADLDRRAIELRDGAAN